jgi:hypothetical protein
MSVSGISSSGLSSYGAQGQQTNFQKIQQEFQQLGQDLQSGNLSAAQSDFSALVTLLPQSSTTSSGQNSNKLLQAFNQLGQDLQAGNLADAQSDYANIQQAFQSQGARRHHHQDPAASQGSTASGSSVSDEFQQLGQALSSGNLSSAQQAYAALQQDFQSSGQTSDQTSGNSGSSSSSGQPAQFSITVEVASVSITA